MSGEQGVSEVGRVSTFAEVRLCPICGSRFEAIAGVRETYCSRRCSNTGASRVSATKRGDLQRGRGNGISYRKLHGRHEHRVIAERKLGRPLLPGEVVHHIDGNIHNNNPDNLQVLDSQSQHASLHNHKLPRGKCEDNNCQRMAVRSVYCAVHYNQWRSGQPNTKRCAVPGCGLMHAARGYCGKHYQVARKMGEFK